MKTWLLDFCFLFWDIYTVQCSSTGNVKKLLELLFIQWCCMCTSYVVQSRFLEKQEMCFYLDPTEQLLEAATYNSISQKRKWVLQTFTRSHNFTVCDHPQQSNSSYVSWTGTEHFECQLYKIWKATMDQDWCDVQLQITTLWKTCGLGRELCKTLLPPSLQHTI